MRHYLIDVGIAEHICLNLQFIRLSLERRWILETLFMRALSLLLILLSAHSLFHPRSLRRPPFLLLSRHHGQVMRIHLQADRSLPILETHLGNQFFGKLLLPRIFALSIRTDVNGLPL